MKQMGNLLSLEKLRAGCFTECNDNSFAHIKAKHLAHEIEDEIAYKYIELPLDSNGRPLKKYTTYYHRKNPYRADYIIFYLDGNFTIVDTEGKSHDYEKEDYIQLNFDTQEKINEDIDLSAEEYCKKYKCNADFEDMSDEKFKMVDLLKRQRVLNGAN